MLQLEPAVSLASGPSPCQSTPQSQDIYWWSGYKRMQGRQHNSQHRTVRFTMRPAQSHQQAYSRGSSCENLTTDQSRTVTSAKSSGSAPAPCVNTEALGRTALRMRSWPMNAHLRTTTFSFQTPTLGKHPRPMRTISIRAVSADSYIAFT